MAEAQRPGGVLLLYSSPRRARAMCCFMKGLRQLIRSRRSSGRLALWLAYSLAIQALMASVGLGMSAFAAPDQSRLCPLQLCVRSDRDRAGPGDPQKPGPPQCPFCFVAAQSAGHVASTGEAPAFPAYAGLLIAALSARSAIGPSSLNSATAMAIPALRPLSPSDAQNSLRFRGAVTHALTENTMRTLSKLAFAALLIACRHTRFCSGSGNSIAVEQPWARATPAGAQTGAVYMTLDNKTQAADRLTGASSDVADKVQIHEMAVENGVMQMRQLAGGLPIPAGGSVVLKPGSYHVMLIGLKKPLTAGETFPLTLTFEKAGNISVTVPVQAMGAMQRTKAVWAAWTTAAGGMGNMEMK